MKEFSVMEEKIGEKSKRGSRNKFDLHFGVLAMMGVEEFIFEGIFKLDFLSNIPLVHTNFNLNLKCFSSLLISFNYLQLMF